MAQIDRLFDKMLSKHASDLHLAEGQKPKIREHGDMVTMEDEPVLTSHVIRNTLQEICEPRRWAKFLKSKDLDFAYQKDHQSRFRCNYYQQVHGIGAVFRIIPTKILSLDELHLPQVLKGLAHLRSGLVLVTGPTGSGKSTTLAAIIHHINQHHARNIVTIEEPIEFVHANKKSFFTQREVGTDTPSFAAGLRTAARQNCDVVLVGEMRDYETVSLALSAATKGALVFGTLHTNSAIKTVDRIVDVFPVDLQAQARVMLAECLRAVCAQQLIKKKGGGRIALNEILLDAPGLAPSIREANNSNIYNIMQSGQARGMILMDDAILEQLKNGNISLEDATTLAENKTAFKEKTKNLKP